MEGHPTKRPRISSSSRSLFQDDPAPSETGQPILKKDCKTTKKGRKRRQKRGTHTINKPQWIPQDDYLLINAFVQLCDPLEVFEQVKFSKTFSHKDVEGRWKELLTNEARCAVSLDAISRLTELEKSALDRKVPFNEYERNLLAKVQCKDVYEASNVFGVNLQPFRKLLQEKPTDFFRSRTPEDLFHCWSLMRVYGLVYPDPYAHNDGVDLDELEHRIVMGKYESTFPSLRDRTIPLLSTEGTGSVAGPSALNPSKRPYITSELVIQELILEKHKQLRRLMRRLRLAGEEAHRWTEAVEHIAGQRVTNVIPTYAYAALSAQHSRFLIKSRQTSFGRATEYIQPDINLSCERYSRRMSRIQGYIRLTDEEDVFIVGNLGKRAILVNDTPLMKGEEMILPDDSILTVDRICLRFSVNRQLLRDVRPLFPRRTSELSLRSSLPLVLEIEGVANTPAVPGTTSGRMVLPAGIGRGTSSARASGKEMENGGGRNSLSSGAGRKLGHGEKVSSLVKHGISTLRHQSPAAGAVGGVEEVRASGASRSSSYIHSVTASAVASVNNMATLSPDNPLSPGSATSSARGGGTAAAIAETANILVSSSSLLASRPTMPPTESSRRKQRLV